LEKFTLTCKVTLPPEAGILTFKPLKMAVEPENVTGPLTLLPPFRRLTPLIPEVVPVPASDTVRLVRFTGVFPLFVKTTRSTWILEAPDNWVELTGAGEPVEICTVSGVVVGVLDAVGVGVATAMVMVAAL
jgi:hypothetical protein